MGYNDEGKLKLCPDSREYFDIRLYSAMVHAARAANDKILVVIFHGLMTSQGSEFECNGKEAISEGVKHVNDILDFCKMRSFQTSSWHIQQYATWILAQRAQNADFSGILKFQLKQLEKGLDGVTREGVEEANKMIMSEIDKYKKFPTIGEFLK